MIKKKDKIKIYFLIHAKSFYPSWKSFLEECINDEKFITKVIYCPVKKLANGCMAQFEEIEKWLIQNKIKYTHIKNINLLLDRPDILVFQTPYPHHREKKYSCSKFKKFGLKPIYISYGLEFTENTRNIRDHFAQPIHNNTWRIYTFSEFLLNDYLKYCPKGNKHVRCVGHPKFDALYNAKNIEIPKWLKEKIKNRKIICWHPHFPCKYSSINGDKIISTFPWEENEKILEYIKNDKENFYIFMAHHMFWGKFQYDFNIQSERLEAFRNQLENMDNSTIWYGEYPEVLHWSDMFLGERSAVTMEMISTNKPVIYLENCPEVYNKFGKDVINSYYYAQNAEEAIILLNKIKKGYDPKQKERQKVFEEYIKPYWDGKCGKRIKEDILSSYKEIKVSMLNICLSYSRAIIVSLFKKVFSITVEPGFEVKHLVITILGIKIRLSLNFYFKLIKK